MNINKKNGYRRMLYLMAGITGLLIAGNSYPAFCKERIPAEDSTIIIKGNRINYNEELRKLIVWNRSHYADADSIVYQIRYATLNEKGDTFMSADVLMLSDVTSHTGVPGYYIDTPVNHYAGPAKKWISLTDLFCIFMDNQVVSGVPFSVVDLEVNRYHYDHRPIFTRKHAEADSSCIYTTFKESKDRPDSLWQYTMDKNGRILKAQYHYAFVHHRDMESIKTYEATYRYNSLGGLESIALFVSYKKDKALYRDFFCIERQNSVSPQQIKEYKSLTKMDRRMMVHY